MFTKGTCMWQSKKKYLGLLQIPLSAVAKTSEGKWGAVQCVTVFFYWMQVLGLEKNQRLRDFTEITHHSLTHCF